ncbi:MAG: acylphosphatase [Nanoarchaeota archaeon]|mgnify:CR=1 FL=1
MKRVHLFISGNVQGVFFRAFVRERAINLGLNGWVKNLEDGRVESVFEGENDKVNRMVELCKKGPSSANIKNINVIKEEVQRERSFVVR